MHALIGVTKQQANFEADMLAKKLWSYKHTNSIVVFTSPQSKEIAVQIAEELDLPYIVHHCKAIRHPGNMHKTIGSITANEIVLHDNSTPLPQGYIQHQVQLLKHSLKKESATDLAKFQDKAIIIVRDKLHQEDHILALVEELNNLDIHNIVVAAVEINTNTLLKFEKKVANIIYLYIHKQPLRANAKQDIKRYHEEREMYWYTRDQDKNNRSKRPIEECIT